MLGERCLCYLVVPWEPGQPRGEGLLPGAHRARPLHQDPHTGLARAPLTQDGGNYI